MRLLILLFFYTIRADETIYNRLRNKSSDILYNLFIKQLIAYITKVIYPHDIAKI